MPNKTLKEIVAITPLIAAFFIFFGFLKLYFYYGHWEIDIVDYLNISEIMLSFLDDLNIVALFILILVIHLVLGLKLVTAVDNAIRRSTEKNTAETNKTIDPSIEKPTELTEAISVVNNDKKKGVQIETLSDGINYVFEKIPWAPRIFMSLLAVVLGIVFFKTKSYLALYGAIIVLLQVLLMLFDEKLANKHSTNFVLILVFSAFTYGISVKNVDDTRIRASTTIDELHLLNDEKIVTSAHYYLVGKTQNYFYLYNDSLNKSEIIPVTEVKRIATVRIVKLHCSKNLQATKNE